MYPCHIFPDFSNPDPPLGGKAAGRKRFLLKESGQVPLEASPLRCPLDSPLSKAFSYRSVQLASRELGLVLSIHDPHGLEKSK